MQAILDFIYKLLVLFKLDHKSWLVKTFVIAGLGLVLQSLWVSLVEQIFKLDLTSKLPDQIHGWALILVGVLIFLLNRHDSLSLDTINDEETSQIVNLGNNRFSITFPRPMRCTPAITFHEPKEHPKIENWSMKGLTVEFPKNVAVSKLRFEADSKPGPPLFWYKLKRWFK